MAKLLDIENLHVSFFTPAGEVKAVNGISYSLDEGKVLGIVGESAAERAFR
jgi:oligopeptide transport system ATP-binding protein